MWVELENTEHTPEPASWTDAIQAAFSGLLICVLILAAFAAAG